MPLYLPLCLPPHLYMHRLFPIGHVEEGSSYIHLTWYTVQSTFFKAVKRPSNERSFAANCVWRVYVSFIRRGHISWSSSYNSFPTTFIFRTLKVFITVIFRTFQLSNTVIFRTLSCPTLPPFELFLWRVYVSFIWRGHISCSSSYNSFPTIFFQTPSFQRTFLSNTVIFATLSFPTLTSFEHCLFQHCRLSNTFLSNTVFFRTLSFPTMLSFEHFPFQHCHLSNTFHSHNAIFLTLLCEHCNLHRIPKKPCNSSKISVFQN